ncbi:hypothetical protein BDZ91DRAFT_779837 [Kalaharituber pfeilii]|nr:hypothetical protein BDZ91DRAFT_779837 [Kalaharituber pfeilii]
MPYAGPLLSRYFQILMLHRYRVGHRLCTLCPRHVPIRMHMFEHVRVHQVLQHRQRDNGVFSDWWGWGSRGIEVAEVGGGVFRDFSERDGNCEGGDGWGNISKEIEDKEEEDGMIVDEERGVTTGLNVNFVGRDIGVGLTEAKLA